MNATQAIDIVLEMVRHPLLTVPLRTEEHRALEMVEALKGFTITLKPTEKETRAKLSGFEDQILDIIHNQLTRSYDGFTTSDLQSTVSVIVDKIYKAGQGGV